MFSACTRKELGLVGQRAEKVTIPKGSTVVHEGKTGREFFIIIEGTAKVTRNGRKVASLTAGDHFGELALFERVPRNASVTATSDLDVVLLDRREFSGLLNEVPTLAFKLLQGMAGRLREADRSSIN